MVYLDREESTELLKFQELLDSCFDMEAFEREQASRTPVNDVVR